jgi:hypothetical protein
MVKLAGSPEHGAEFRNPVGHHFIRRLVVDWRKLVNKLIITVEIYNYWSSTPYVDAFLLETGWAG